MHVHGTKVLRLFHPDEGVIEPRRLVVIFMLLVAWICLMWAQFYTESFAFVSMGSMYRLATTDTDPSSIHSPVYLRHVTVYVRAPAMPLVAVKAVSPWNISSSVANALNISVRYPVLSQWNISAT